jgi:hypothetical protein
MLTVPVEALNLRFLGWPCPALGDKRYNAVQNGGSPQTAMPATEGSDCMFPVSIVSNGKLNILEDPVTLPFMFLVGSYSCQRGSSGSDVPLVSHQQASKDTASCVQPSHNLLYPLSTWENRKNNSVPPWLLPTWPVHHNSTLLMCQFHLSSCCSSCYLLLLLGLFE